MKTFYKWLVLFMLINSAVVLATFQGILGKLISYDISYLSVVILSLFYCVSIYLGYVALKAKHGIGHQRNMLRLANFIQGHFFSLGILGTICGLIYMTFDVLGGGGATTDNAVIIDGLIKGLGTSLSTTAMGIVASVLTHIQIYLVEHHE